MRRLIQKIKIWFIANILVFLWGFFENIKVKVATTEEELEDVFSLRWKMYAKLGYIDLQDFPNQKLQDKYDKSSLNLIAYKNGCPVGTLRLVLSSKKGFPTEKAFNIINFGVPREKIGEISKFCIEKTERKSRKKIFLCLIREAYKLSKKHKIDYWLIGIPYGLKNYIEKNYIEKFNFPVAFHKLEVGPLKPENIKERKTAKKYFEKQQIIPFLVDLRKI